jgi:hypothetical protein
VPYAHNVDSGNALPNLPVHAFEVAQYGFLPVIPVPVEELFADSAQACLRREPPVEHPNCAITMGTESWVSRIYIPKSRDPIKALSQGPQSRDPHSRLRLGQRVLTSKCTGFAVALTLGS